LRWWRRIQGPRSIDRPLELAPSLASRSDDVASALDRIPGAWERMQFGREQAARGDVVELGKLLTAPPSSR
jgi:hypothetical protein